MTDINYSPKWIIVEFLRNRLTDPRNRAENKKIQTYTAASGQTSFSMTAPAGSISCVISVTVNSIAQVKWQDYYIDFRNEKIIFFSGLSFEDSVEVHFKYGSTNWIFWDKPAKNLSDSAFPRMNTIIVIGDGTRIGNFEAPVEGHIHFQIDIWTKEKSNDNFFTIDGRKYAGDELAEYLAYLVTKAFENHEGDLHPALYSYKPVSGPKSLPFSEEYQAHHKTVEFVINGLEVGRLKT
jgi:hypothetical protein